MRPCLSALTDTDDGKKAGGEQLNRLSLNPTKQGPILPSPKLH